MALSEQNVADVPPDGRTRRRIERTNEVFEAAIELFIERGYDSTTMDDIAERAEVARASVFNYFPRKLAFLEEWASRRRHRAVAAVRAEHLEDDSIGVILARYFDELARVSTDTRAETVALMTAAAISPNFLNEPPLGHELAHYVARAQSGGELRSSIDSAQVGLLLATGYFATVCQWIATEPVPFDLGAELRGLLDVVLRGILD